MSIKFDPDKKAVIEPKEMAGNDPNFPKGRKLSTVAVSCFSSKLFQSLLNAFPNEYLFKEKDASRDYPIYEISVGDIKLLAYQSPVGSPTCARVYEKMIALGVKNLFIFGTCGVLNKNILDCSIIIPTSSIREEGTSFHYLPDSEEIEMDTTFIKDFEEYLTTNNIAYIKGKNWTTDAIFRETKNKVKYFQSKGVISVDMEASAMSAVAKFRGVNLLQFFYSADNLDSEEWDMRSLACSDKLEEKFKIWEILLGFIVNIKEKLQ